MLACAEFSFLSAHFRSDDAQLHRQEFLDSFMTATSRRPLREVFETIESSLAWATEIDQFFELCDQDHDTVITVRQLEETIKMYGPVEFIGLQPARPTDSVVGKSDGRAGPQTAQGSPWSKLNCKTILDLADMSFLLQSGFVTSLRSELDIATFRTVMRTQARNGVLRGLVQHALQYAGWQRRCNEVFDLCDTQNAGLIQIRNFERVIQEYGPLNWMQVHSVDCWIMPLFGDLAIDVSTGMHFRPPFASTFMRKVSVIAHIAHGDLCCDCRELRVRKLTLKSQLGQRAS